MLVSTRTSGSRRRSTSCTRSSRANDLSRRIARPRPATCSDRAPRLGYNRPVTFDALYAHPALRAALDARGYVEPTPVQASVLEPDLYGRDLLVSSRTGSGKTVAFGLVLARSLLGDGLAFGPPAPRAARGLVPPPTRH